MNEFDIKAADWDISNKIEIIWNKILDQKK